MLIPRPLPRAINIVKYWVRLHHYQHPHSMDKGMWASERKCLAQGHRTSYNLGYKTNQTLLHKGEQSKGVCVVLMSLRQ